MKPEVWISMSIWNHPTLKTLCESGIWEYSVFELGAFLRQQNVVSSQIFYIFHHSNVFVIVKRLAQNYVNLRAFDMYKFGCFENGHFSRLKPPNLSEDWGLEKVSDFKQSEVRSSDAPFRPKPIFTIFGPSLGPSPNIRRILQNSNQFSSNVLLPRFTSRKRQDKNFNGFNTHQVNTVWRKRLISSQNIEGFCGFWTQAQSTGPKSQSIKSTGLKVNWWQYHIEGS